MESGFLPPDEPINEFTFWVIVEEPAHPVLVIGILLVVAILVAGIAYLFWRKQRSRTRPDSEEARDG